MDKKVLLMILDGWGEGRHDRSNAIYTQGTPNLDGSGRSIPYRFLKPAERTWGCRKARWATPKSGI